MRRSDRYCPKANRACSLEQLAPVQLTGTSRFIWFVLVPSHSSVISIGNQSSSERTSLARHWSPIILQRVYHEKT